MKAVVLTGYGDVDRLELRDVPDPRVGPEDVKVRMAGASINPIDWKLRSGSYAKMMPLEMPTILGKDASGQVVEVGANVTTVKPGARVMARVNGGYAELVVARADEWVEVPAALDLADAGALPLVLLTGAQLAEEAAGVREGQRLLVTGATGSVGRVAVFVARARGARVYAGVRRSQKAAASALGADVVVALDDDRDVASLPELDAIADTVGGETTQKLLARVKRGGTIGSVVGPPAGAADRGLTVRSILAHSDRASLAQLARAVADKKLLIPIAARFPLAQARDAHQRAQEGAGGKVILLG
jgi:NADPH:quinone reductase-like Zn-dependent oxidoreductase